jgi:hypothetical protein
MKIPNWRFDSCATAFSFDFGLVSPHVTLVDQKWGARHMKLAPPIPLCQRNPPLG